MRLSRGLVAAASGLLVAVSGCTSSQDTAADPSASASSTPAAPQAAEIAWSDCDAEITGLLAGQAGSERDLAFECGRTEVPISYDEPQGDTLPLFLVRARWAQQTDRIGSLVINPGGPGASGADAAIGSALTLPEDVLRRFDVVGFDPRADAEQQTTSLEASFDAFAANCTGLVAGCPLGPDPRRFVEELLDQATTA